MMLQGMMLVREQSERDVNARWLGLSAGDVLEPIGRYGAETELRGARRAILASIRHGDTVPRRMRLFRVRLALFARELLRRDEEARIAACDDLVPENFRRWPARELWMSVACDGCDYTREKALELDHAVDVSRKAWWAAPRNSREEAQCRVNYDEAQRIRREESARWSPCTGNVLYVRRRALWEQTPAAKIDAIMEAWGLAASYEAA